jgi:hypothetical protein
MSPERSVSLKKSEALEGSKKAQQGQSPSIQMRSIESIT